MVRRIFPSIATLLLVLLLPASCNYAAVGSTGIFPWYEKPTEIQASLASPERPTRLPSQTPSRTPTPFQPLPTSTPTPSPTITPTITPTSTASATLIPTLTPTPTIPAEATISNISGHPQWLSIDCEAAAAKDWAQHFGVALDELKFQSKLPHSDNPDFGFVGNPNSPWGGVPPYGYGVYAGPVADLLNKFGVPARAYKGYSIEQLKAKIAAGIPVIAWVIANGISGIPIQYIDSQGRIAVVAMYEHVVIVTGYTENHIYFMSEGVFYASPTPLFLKSWGVLNNMVIVDQ